MENEAKLQMSLNTNPYTMPPPKKKKWALIITISVVVFTVLVVAGIISYSVLMNEYYLQEGKKSLNMAETTFSPTMVEESLDKAVTNLKAAILCNKSNIIRKTGPSESYYLLGKAYLYLGDNGLAEEAFRNAQRTYSKKDDFATLEQINLLLSQSKVTVNAVMGGNRALVNGNIVREGDMVKGVKVLHIKDTYVVFEDGNTEFSISIDQYDPLARQWRSRCRNYFEQAKKIENLGFARLQFEEVEVFIRHALRGYQMDEEQVREMEILSRECQEEVNKIDKMIKEAKSKGNVIIGMTESDVTEVLGDAPEENKLFQMDSDKVWIYDKFNIYFKESKSSGEAIVIEIKNKE